MKIRRYISLMTLAAMSVSAGAEVRLMYGEDIDRGWGDAGSVVTPYVTYSSDYISPYAGNEIRSVRVGVQKEGTNCYIYFKRSPQDGQSLYRQKVERLEPGWNEITLDTPFSITAGEALAIGYKASFAEAGGVGVSQEKFTEATTVYYNSRNQWTTADGSVCIEAVIDGDNMPEDDLWISKLTEVADLELPTDTHAYTGYVRNKGANAVESYKIDVMLDGEKVASVDGGEVALNGRGQFRFEVASDAIGTHDVRAVIAGVNGREDTNAADNEASVSFTVRDPRFARKVVCEEYTGTWCGLCPRGIVGLELMKEKYPDSFFAVCVHGNDPMEITEYPDMSYAEFIGSCSGAPYCNVNRRFTGDPFMDIQNLYNLETASESHLAVEAAGVWNSDMTAIEMTATYMSDIDQKGQRLNIAYTVTESGVTGYAQTNYYSDGRNGDFYGWGNKAAVTDDLEFEDVARAIVGGYGGMACHEGDMTALRPYSHTFTVEVPSTVADKSNVKIIAQIIDPSTGFIVNAAQVVPGMSGADSMEAAGAWRVYAAGGRLVIEAAEGGSAEASVCDMCGRLVAATAVAEGRRELELAAGIYVVTLSEKGSVVKRIKIMI